MRKSAAEKYSSFGLCIILIAVINLTSPDLAQSQLRSGAAFLKMLPGARPQSLGYSLTGALDELQSFYANPALSAFSREWFWTGSYTKWFTDIYNVSFNYGRTFNTLLHRRTQFAFGINYLGMKEFDSTLRMRESVSASDLLLTANISMPINFISRQVSWGANLKYLHSELSHYNADAFIIDVGAMWCSKRFALLPGFFEYGMVSAGIAANQLGQPLKFKSIATPLPRSYSIGGAVNMGTHHGLQLQLTADYRLVSDEIDRFSLGTEISWGYRFSMRGGYSFNENQINKLSMGLSFRIDSSPALIDRVSSKNDALRLDIAGLEGNDIFNATYRGTINHYPVGPEKFDLILPVNRDTLQSSRQNFIWNISRDPDLYDDVAYLLVIEKSAEIDLKQSILYRMLNDQQSQSADLVDIISKNWEKFFFIKDSCFDIKSSTGQVCYFMKNISPGDYFWTVVAHDRDRHFRIADNRIHHFHVLYPDIEIESIDFIPSPWITKSDTQGVIQVRLANRGDLNAENVLLTITSRLQAGFAQQSRRDTLYQKMIAEIPENTSRTVETIWLNSSHGLFDIEVRARIVRSLNKFGKEINLENNQLTAPFFTIPKGNFTIADTVIAFMTPKTDKNLPFMSRIFFDKNSSDIRSEYRDSSNWFYPPLEILANRLKMHPEIYLKLRGYADAASGETMELAHKRVQAVYDKLLELGVLEHQMPLTELSWAFSKHKKATLNQNVQQERRFVMIDGFHFDDNTPAMEILQSIRFKTVEEDPVSLPLMFSSQLKAVAPVKNGYLIIDSDVMTDSTHTIFNLHAADSLDWLPSAGENKSWFNKTATYTICLTDTLGREFRTRSQNVYLANVDTHLPLVVGLAEFNSLNPYPIADWTELMKQLKMRLSLDKHVHLRFVGHACGIPPNTVNNKYSKIRALIFQQQFIRELEKYHITDPDFYKLVLSRLDQNGTIGKGSFQPFSCIVDRHDLQTHQATAETQSFSQIKQIISAGAEGDVSVKPFVFKINPDQIKLIGDNNSPEGRQINRRIEIQLYFPDPRFSDNYTRSIQ